MTEMEMVDAAVALMRQALRLLDDAEAGPAACHLQHAIDAALGVPLPVPHIILPPLD